MFHIFISYENDTRPKNPFLLFLKTHSLQKGRRRPAAGLKYIMLNAAVHFKEIVEEARSVILIGGTLQPVAPIVSQLFPHLPPNRIDVFSCGHVIPPENLTALCVTKGPTGLDFDFTHKSRGLATQMDELGRLLLNVCRVTPGGVVVFLPSYQYEETSKSIIYYPRCELRYKKRGHVTLINFFTIQSFTAGMKRASSPSCKP